MFRDGKVFDIFGSMWWNILLKIIGECDFFFLSSFAGRLFIAWRSRSVLMQKRSEIWATAMDLVIYHQITKNVQEWVESSDTPPVLHASISNIWRRLMRRFSRWSDSGLHFPPTFKTKDNRWRLGSSVWSPFILKKGHSPYQHVRRHQTPTPHPHPTSTRTLCTHKEQICCMDTEHCVNAARCTDPPFKTPQVAYLHLKYQQADGVLMEIPPFNGRSQWGGCTFPLLVLRFCNIIVRMNQVNQTVTLPEIYFLQVFFHFH